MDLSYASYLHLDELLALQEPRAEPAEHDELLFIIVHQVYELWFKLLLHELDKICGDLRSDHLYGAIEGFKRTRTILKVAVEQVDVIETLTPLSFGSFRQRLEHASGFQSVQFRELEFLLGYKRPDLLRYHPADSPGRARLERRLREPSVVDRFYAFLGQHGVNVPAPVEHHEAARSAEANEVVAEGILELYRTQPDLRILFELMTDFDEGFQEWRYRHIKLVERTIGNKPGTGGSLGVEFLKATLFHPIFPDLWAIRHKM